MIWKIRRYKVVTFRIFLLVLAGLVGLLTCPVLVRGNVPVLSDEGTDVVFVVDQSGSMGGSRVHPQANDPAGLRIDLLNDLMVRLFGGSSQSLAMSDSRSYRLSVIEFGDSARVGLDWFVVCVSADQSRSEAAQLAELKRRYCDRLNRNINLGNTNHLDAVKLASRQFERIDWGRDGAEARDLAIVVITDGQSYVDSPPYFSGGYFASSRYLNDLAREIGNLSGTGQHSKPDFVVVGLEDRIHGGQEWSRSKSLWERHASAVYSIPSPDSLYRALDDLAARLTGTASYVVGDSLEVPCYVAKLRLTVYHSGPMSQFVLRDPNGKLVQLATKQVTKGMRFRVYDVDQPTPGVWKLEGNRRSYRVRVDVHYQKTTLITPAPPDPEVPSNPLRFRWLVQTTNDSPFKPVAGCQLRAITVVEKATGELDTVPMRLDPASPGVFEAERDWQSAGPGDYHIQLFGLAPLSSGAEILVFGSRRIRIVVSDRQPLAGEVLTPSVFRWSIGTAESQLRVKTTSLDSSTVIPSISTISASPDTLISFEVLSGNGELIQAQTALSGVPNSDPAEFVADIDVDREYTFFDWIGLSLLQDDSLIVRFHVNQKVLHPDYGIYGFGVEPFESFDHAVESRRSLVTDGAIALTLIYILVNVLLLLSELVWWALIPATSFVAGIRQMRLFHRKAYYDSKLRRSIKGRHRYLFGKVPWTIFDRVFALRTLVIRSFAHSAKIPFTWLEEEESWPLEGLALWRRPFSRVARVKIYPLAKPKPTPEERSVETRMRKEIFEIGGPRATRLPKGLGELGIDIN